MMNYQNKTWHLKSRPEGQLKPTDLVKVETTIDSLDAGKCLIAIRYLAMDPATRGWMGESGGYMDPLPLDGPVWGVVVGEVIASEDPAVSPGLIVTGLGPWGKYVVAEVSETQTGALGVLAPMNTDSGHQLQQYLHAMGTSGATAWYGLLEIAAMKPGDRVFVSAAEGSVGSLVVQIAKLKGAKKVVGTAGTDAKCQKVVQQYGADSCINYRDTENMAEALKSEFPEGIDVYFDNVGGEILEAAVDNLATNARIAICGLISQYNNKSAQGAPLRNVWNLLVHEATMRGFLVSSFFGTPACADAFEQLGTWLNDGKLNAIVDEREMFDDIVTAYNLLFTGEKLGRLVVKIAH